MLITIIFSPPLLMLITIIFSPFHKLKYVLHNSKKVAMQTTAELILINQFHAFIYADKNSVWDFVTRAVSILSNN